MPNEDYDVIGELQSEGLLDEETASAKRAKLAGAAAARAVQADIAQILKEHDVEADDLDVAPLDLANKVGSRAAFVREVKKVAAAKQDALNNLGRDELWEKARDELWGKGRNRK